MKAAIPFLLVLSLTSNVCFAQNILMRSPLVPIQEYQQHLAAVGAKPFAQAVIENADLQSSNPEAIDRCLFALSDTPGQSADICFETTKLLSKTIWTASIREMLELLFSKLSSTPSKHQKMYKELHKSLISSQAAEDFMIPGELDSPLRKEALNQVKLKFQDAVLLINGVPANKAYFLRGHEIYQWMVVTNWGQVIAKVGRWSEFKTELQTQKLRTLKSCDEVNSDNVWVGGLGQVQYYFSKDCKNMVGEPIKKNQDTAQSLPKFPDVKPSAMSPWVPVLALVGLGLAASLKGKQVSVTGMKF